jgi:molybdenum cofactor cytidylyltransferase
MISAVVLAAGLSTRMGRPKLVMPWGSTTVIGHVVTTLTKAGLGSIVVVTGAARREVETALKQEGGLVKTVFNARYAEDDMLESLHAGMAMLGDEVDAMLVVLGDQPQMEVDIVQLLVETYQAERYPLIVPSYHMHRGHPWLVDHMLWNTLRSLPPNSTMRDFLDNHSQLITYLPVTSPSILNDLDTPEDYARFALA